MLHYSYVIAGVDEAGRGPLVGPLVVALVEVEDENLLKEIGVKDSKLLDHKEREELYNQILDISKRVLVERVEPFVIDEYVSVRGLNRLEMEVMSGLISRSKADIIYVDAPDVDTNRFEKMLREKTGKNVVASHRADRIYPVVSAASIVAKVVRDRIIRGIEAVYGRVGSGYPHDSETVSFVERWIKDMGRVPTFVRRSWKTIRTINKKLSQSSLEDFLP